MSRMEQIIDEINSFIDEDTGMILENDENIEEISQVIEYVNEKYNVNIECMHVGGFDSPGLNVKCYSWAGIIDGELLFDGLEVLCY